MNSPSNPRGCYVMEGVIYSSFDNGSETQRNATAEEVIISDTLLRVTEENERLRHYISTCGGTDNDGRCPMPGLAGLPAEKEDISQAPIAKVTVWDHLPPSVEMYTPGLPPGEHDLYCEPPDPRGQKVPHPCFEKNGDQGDELLVRLRNWHGAGSDLAYLAWERITDQAKRIERLEGLLVKVGQPLETSERPHVLAYGGDCASHCWCYSQHNTPETKGSTP
jgi:hypothetical protein